MEIANPRPVRVKSFDQEIHLHATGDWHVGEAGCAEGRLRAAVQDMASDKSAVVLLMGDLGGYVATDDKRWDPASVSSGLSIRDLEDWEAIVTERIVSIAKPISRKVLGVLAGNHERTYGRRHHVNVTRSQAAGIGCPPLGYSCLCRLRFVCGDEQRSLDLVATHGAGAAVTEGAKINRLIRTMNSFPYADLVLIAHMHVGLSHRLPRLYQSETGVGEKIQVGVVTGSYLRTYCEGHSSYGEERGYPPSAIGHPVIDIVPNRGVCGIRWM